MVDVPAWAIRVPVGYCEPHTFKRSHREERSEPQIPFWSCQEAATNVGQREPPIANAGIIL